MNNAYFLFLAGILFLVISCDEVFLEDISKDHIVIISPADSIRTDADKQLFLWDKLQGASEYHLLIVSPDLATSDTVVLDITITKNSYAILLDPGKYQWCVRGINEAYETENNCRILEIIQ